MRTNEVKEDKDRNSGVGRFKRMKPAFGFVPSLKTVVKGFNQVIADIIFEALNTDMIGFREITFGRHHVGTVTIADNSVGVAHMGNMTE